MWLTPGKSPGSFFCLAAVCIGFFVPVLAQEKIKGVEQSRKVSSIVKDKPDNNVNAKILALLELAQSTPEAVPAELEKLDENPALYNSAESYLLSLVKARVLFEDGEIEQALSALESAKKASTDIPEHVLNQPKYLQLYLLLADVYAAKKQFDLAYAQKKEYLKRYQAYSDKKNADTVRMLNKKYETDRKLKENELINNQNILKQFQIRDAENQKNAQQKNFILLIVTTLVFFVLSLRQFKVRRVLQKMAQTDSLTKLLNRKALFAQGQLLTGKAVEEQSEFSAIVLDIDFFKRINDDYSHDIADKVLQQVARLGNETMRSRDIFARIGGEEFAAILPEANLDEAKAIAERLREKIFEYNFSHLGIDCPVSASFGVASLHQVIPQFELLLHAADKAMSVAKKKGCNQVVSFSPHQQM
ncbi:GGDEF domain-containing protein [Thalassomonas viridans]|uniref:diguanylate cyclase n=1 Tax=Thalassomonas viridans TaxID=137584 RepID=A0AAE9Z2V1_9GAMM|nr:GGDEF domain-containing protein [Thalassomonas viridans]WDE04208.1 GGDEF domain-containing protein [Thalassomonas viridans]